MKLRFLGQTYSLSSQQMPTVASENQACFRGQRYSLRIPVANPASIELPSQVSAVIHKYRGVSYVVERGYFDRQPTNPKYIFSINTYKYITETKK